MESYLKIVIVIYIISLTYLLFLNSRVQKIQIHAAFNGFRDTEKITVFVQDNNSQDEPENEPRQDVHPQEEVNDSTMDNQPIYKPTKNMVSFGQIGTAPTSSTYQDSLSRDQDVVFNRTLLDEYNYHVMKYRKSGICQGLFMNNSKALHNAAKLISEDSEKSFGIGLEEFPSITQNCSIYRKTRDFQNKPRSSEESSFPLAFSILTYNNIEQLERFVHIIYHPQNVYCIHVDNKSSEAFKTAVRSMANCFTNVFVASKLETIVYASYSRLQADINCMQELLGRKEQWKYLLNFASSEMALKPNIEMVRILKLFRGANDIHEVFARRATHRYLYKYSMVKGKLRRGNEFLPPPPFNLTITKGQAYNIFSRAFIQFALNSKMATRFLEWCRNTYSPDEHFWATLNNLYHNSFLHTPGGYKGHPDSRTYVTRHINWETSFDHCYGQYIRHICVFGYGDLPLLKRKGHFGTNKFDVMKNPIAYSCMEELLSNRMLHPTDVDAKHWSTINFIKNRNA